VRAVAVGTRAFAALLLALATCVCGRRATERAETRDLVWFLRRLHDVSHLPELEASATEMESTWDRSGGNTDWAGYSRIEGDAYIPVDIDGPGCIHRIFTGVVDHRLDDTRVEITLDHADAPLIDVSLRDFLAEGRGTFPGPLVTRRSYPGSLFPIPFSRHARVRIVSPSHVWGGYWQITWTRYAPGTPVRSLRLPLTAAERSEVDRVRGQWALAERTRPPLPSGTTPLRRGEDLSPGASFSVASRGAGVVRELRIRVTPDAATRHLRMRWHWDGADTPAMDVSVGDFFGVSVYGNLASVPYSSLLMGAQDHELWTRLPMPFARGARVTFENRAPFPVRVEATLEVEARTQIPSDWGRLHVAPHTSQAASPTAPRVQGVPVHDVLDVQGRGKYIGVMMQVAWSTADWWGEGDWLIWADSHAWPPRYHGTGTEEYFNSGWERFDRLATAGFITFQPLPVAIYAFHLNDAFQFQRSLKVQVETVGHPGANAIIARDHPAWTTTAFWYAPP
jgi:hypothetical protein